MSITIVPSGPTVYFYGTAHRFQVFKVWFPTQAISTPIPLVAHFPSGGWMSQVVLPNSLPNLFTPFLNEGFAVAIVGYAWTGMPGTYSGIYPNPEKDAQMFVRHIRGGTNKLFSREFIALDGRSAGAQGVMYAGFQPNTDTIGSRPDVIMVSALAAHMYTALQQNVSSSLGPHLGGGAKLNTVATGIQNAASPKNWLFLNQAINNNVIAHIISPNSKPSAPVGGSVFNKINHNHDSWNALTLDTDLRTVSPEYVQKGSFINLATTQQTTEKAYELRARWLRNLFLSLA